MKTLLWEMPEPGIVVLTLNRPERHNAITPEWITEMHEVVSRIDADPAIRVVILTAAGRSFCSGFDLDREGDTTFDPELAQPHAGLLSLTPLTSLVLRLCRLQQPLIAAINGPVIGAGVALTLAADIRIASTAASFHIMMTRIGLSAAECGISWLLPRLVGLSRAMEPMLTGRCFDAAEAERMGLLSRLVAPDQLLPTAMETARLIAANAAFAVATTKAAVRYNLETPGLETAIAWENRNQVMTSAQGDVFEAVRAFREQHKSGFKPTTISE